MEALKLHKPWATELNLDSIDRDVTEWDQKAYERITTVVLSPEQIAQVEEPSAVYPKQRYVVGLHWHPEFVPLEVISKRIDRMFPNREDELIIPTQHNVLVEYNGYTGVEIDCYSAGFNRKVQLLVHFSARRVDEADVLRSMLEHTRKYRASQLYEFIDSVLDPAFQDRVEKAAAKTGTPDELIEFVRIHVGKLKTMIDQNERTTPTDMLKNKIIRNYFNELRANYSKPVIDRAQVFLTAVKKIVKAHFSLTYFYRTTEVIEEVRSLGGGVIIPHPEQFWPILLGDYDIDGIEVWNPQSLEYTEFLINVVNRQNKHEREGRRPLLVTMGDDTHFGEKTIDPALQDPAKAGRELGVQPAWDDLSIRKSLIVANVDRKRLIDEYRARLDG